MFVSRSLKGVLLLSLVSAVALAGTKWSYPVVISVGSRTAYGSFADTRASPDANAYLYCSTTSGTSGNCYARVTAPSGASGIVSAACTTTDANMIRTIQSLDSDSYVQFNWGPTGAACTAVYSFQGSPYSPVQP